MKKIVFIFTLFSLFPFVPGQVGINTAIPNSTLVVEGSYEGAYKEITSNTTLTIVDQYVTVTGASAVTVTLPDGTGSNSFSGRVYHIRNNSTQNVTLTGFGGSQLMRITGTNNASSYTIPAGGYIHIVKNDLSNVAGPLWEISFLGMSLSTNTKTLTYVRKTVSPIDANTPISSLVTIGNLNVRFNATNPTASGSIEYQPIVNNHITVLYHKGGAGSTNNEFWGINATVTGTWYRMPGGNFAEWNLSQVNRDIGYAYIVLHNTKEVYRVTANVNGDISASGSVPATSSSVTLFVEKLD